MSPSTLSLPQETSWKLLAVSSDMMDTDFCNKLYPFRWRSSLAVSAFEPRAEDVPDDLCEGRLTMLKLTTTITGYQPTREETEEGYASFPDVPTEELSRILDQYFGCYGAMLNVAVFPHPERRVVDRRVAIDFDGQSPESPPSSPLTVDQSVLTAVEQDTHRVVDVPLAEGGVPGLDLFQQFVVTTPPASRVEARVVHFNAAVVTMAAFRGSTQVDTTSAGPEDGQIHELIIEGSGIDRVEFSVPQGEAALIGFAYTLARTEPFGLNDFPHVIDVEPKNRDLIQASSETGEILTTSKSNVKTNKSLTHTESSETGYELTAMVGKKDKYNVAGKLSHKNTEQEQENWSVGTDASRERQEKEGSTTQVSQLYNLLSSYHIGTNRAQFLMLARPHVLQPTDHRTFVDGLRQIEGVQEFVLIVARPPDMEGLAIEATLETGHFPEGLIPELPPEEYEESFEEFKVTAFADNGWFSGDCTNINATHDVASGWVVDPRPERGHDAGHQGLSEISNDSNGQANSSLEGYNYQKTGDASVLVTGRICGESAQRDKARFDRTYRVFTRSVNPKPTSAGPRVPIDRLLITSRGLCVRFRSGEDCPQIDPRFDIRDVFDDLVIVDEQMVAMSRSLMTPSAIGGSRVPAMKELLGQVRSAMTTSWRRPQRRMTEQAPGFLESDYFADQIKKILPQERLDRPVSDIVGLARYGKDLGREMTVGDALGMDLSALSQETGLTTGEAKRFRRAVLGLSDTSADRPTAT